MPDGSIVLPGDREVVLAGVHVPEPMAGEAALLLDPLLEGPYEIDTLSMDRYGRPVALVLGPEGEAVQELLLSRGLAYADPLGVGPESAARFLAIEAQAREARAGLWRDAALGEQSAETMGRRTIPRYSVVRGEVRRHVERGSVVYLDFGEDWRRDFSIRLTVADARRLRKAGLDPASLVGARVRVRGWVFSSYGPMIDVVVKEQIEVLE
jgi:hypothetical protein